MSADGDPMTAVRVPEHGSAEVLESVDAPVPEPGPGEVRVDIRAAGVNFADVEQRRGNYPDGPTPPYRPGLEVAGTVDATGPGVELSPGQRVAGLVESGGYADYAVAPADRLFSVPDSLGFPAAAALPVQYLTAHNALFEWGELAAGERVLVTAAAGGVGTAAVQLAAAADATVIAAASTTEKRELAASLGADTTVDYADIRDRTAVDLALDGVGGGVFSDAVKALAPGGRLVTIGMASGRVPTVAAPRLIFENRSVIGYHLTEALERTPERVMAAVGPLLDAVASDAVEVVVDDTASLSAASRVHERLEERASTGKLVLVPSETDF